MQRQTESPVADTIKHGENRNILTAKRNIMDFWQGFWIITGIHLLAAASPGPDFVLVTQQSLSRNRPAGLLTSLGIALGFAVHVVYSVFGLAAVVAHSAHLLTAIKVIGGLYLIYIGIKGLRAKAGHHDAGVTAVTAEESPMKTVLRGFLCNVLNPKAAVFMLSLFVVVLSPDTPLWQLAAYGTWMVLTLFLWFAGVTFVLSVPAVNRRFRRIGHWIDRVCGGVLMLLGIKVLTGR